MKLVLALCALLPLSASASTTFTGAWTVSSAVPDNDDVGYADTRTLSATRITDIQNVSVELNFSGGWNGDLYAYLVHDSGFAVLLNRPGRSVTTPDGSASQNLNITLDDSYALDIHSAIPMSGSVVGNYQPDGRRKDPLVVLITDPRTAMLSSFEGMGANGSWTLFVADQSAGGTATLLSWGMTVTGTYSPGVQTSAGDYNVGSVFNWEMGTTPADTAGGIRGDNYGAVDVFGGALTGSDAVFNILLDGAQTFADPFWDQAHSWTDIFTDGASTSLGFESIFSSFSYGNTQGSLDPSNYGSFSISGSTLSWAVVPEPTTALSGLLLAMGMLGRRRFQSHEF